MRRGVWHHSSRCPFHRYGSTGDVLLALSAACVAFDRFFGLSSAWMRDVLGSQSIQRRLDQYQHHWAEELLQADASAVPGIERRLRLIHSFLAVLHEIIGAETRTWEEEFQRSVSQLRESGSAVAPAESCQRGGTAAPTPQT